jgi:hypothetical protein
MRTNKGVIEAMKLNGYMIMDRLKELKEQAAEIDGQFDASLFAFEAEKSRKADPRDLMKQYSELETKIARLETVQSQYNLQVTVNVADTEMPLELAVKLAGPAGRVKNRWKNAASAHRNPMTYGYGSQQMRVKENEYADPVLSTDECLALMRDASKLASAITLAIRGGNGVMLEIDADESLFD